MMNAVPERISEDETLKRLSQFQQLSTVIDKAWLKRQLKKRVEQYSLITGWLTSSENEWRWMYRKFTSSLDKAIEFLAAKTSTQVWNKLRSKIKSQSDRAETKGTLAEIALAVFLAQNDILFDLETRLNPTSDKDVDFSLKFADLKPVHIEVQWISESDSSSRAADTVALYGLAANIDFPDEERRIRGKVFGKTAKLTKDDITLVALDCTTSPELSGEHLFTPISEALTHIFGTQVYGPLTESDTAIRELVDGVIWFENDIYHTVFPTKRSYILNEHSSHYRHPSLVKWIEVWSTNE